MNQHALVIVGRQNPPAPGRSPFSGFGTGFCVHPDGVVATCWHTVNTLFQRFAPIAMPTRRHPGTETWPEPQPHEVPSCAFLTGVLPHGEAALFSLMNGTGHIDDDTGLLELGGPRPSGPLPAVSTSEREAAVGEFIHFIGHHQPEGVPLDPDGNTGGFALTCQGGKIVAVDDIGFCFDYVVAKGMSGAPVFRPGTGEVIGMVVETWSAALAEQQIGVRSPVTRAVGIHRVLRHFASLRERATARAAAGGRPWCDLPEGGIVALNSREDR